MQSSQNPGKNRAREAEAGFMLLAAVVMVALVLIALAVAAPVVARQLRRDKEVESQHRAEQYVRAIQLYYKKTKTYPPSIKALENTNNVRFLRQEYVDPLTGKSDWRLLHLGQQQTKIHVFFGEELAGLTAGLGSAAGMQSNVGGSGGTAATSSTSTIGATSALASGFSGASVTTTTAGSAGTTGGASPGGTSGSTTGSSGAFGDGTGGAIVGVGTARTGESITEPNQQTSYETWEFWYDPKIELLYAQGRMNGGLGSTTASSFGKDATSGQPNGAGGVGGTPGSTGPTSTGTPGIGAPQQ